MQIKYSPQPLSIDSADWQGTTIDVASFRPESSDHRPQVTLTLAHDEQALKGLFVVNDRYVRCVKQHFQDMVCEDSCVEIFLQPHDNPKGSYLSLEISGNGTLLSYLIHDPTRTESGFVDYRPLTTSEGGQYKVITSLPKMVDPELDQPTTWHAAFEIPKQLLRELFGDQYSDTNKWRMNAFKCGDQTSHPHWASWQPVPEFNFHDPSAFALIELT